MSCPCLYVRFAERSVPLRSCRRSRSSQSRRTRPSLGQRTTETIERCLSGSRGSGWMGSISRFATVSPVDLWPSRTVGQRVDTALLWHDRPTARSLGKLVVRGYPPDHLPSTPPVLRGRDGHLVALDGTVRRSRHLSSPCAFALTYPFLPTSQSFCPCSPDEP